MIVIIFQDETLNLQGMYTPFKIHIYSIVINKTFVMDQYNHFLYQVVKDFIQNFIHMKKLFWDKRTCNPCLK